jgi:phosphoenolpyruvate-protein kinase (PTS system EI component)
MGLGLETFSMPPMFVPIVKEIIRKSTYKKAREIAEYAIGLHDAAKIRKLLIKETRALIPFIEEIIPG